MDNYLQPDAHRSESCGCPQLCHCDIFDAVFVYTECQGDLIGQTEDPTVVWEFVAYSVKIYIFPF